MVASYRTNPGSGTFQQAFDANVTTGLVGQGVRTMGISVIGLEEASHTGQRLISAR